MWGRAGERAGGKRVRDRAADENLFARVACDGDPIPQTTFTGGGVRFWDVQPDRWRESVGRERRQAPRASSTAASDVRDVG